MTNAGYRLTRFADDWVVICKSRKEAEEALNLARDILGKLGLQIHPDKTRITNISNCETTD